MSPSSQRVSIRCQPERTVLRAAGKAILWAQRASLKVSISACSREAPPAWSWRSLTGRMIPGRRVSFRSTQRSTAPTITGTCSCRAYEPRQLYGYRVHGPCDPARGLRFDPAKVLLDPYGRAVAVPKQYNRDARAGGGQRRHAMKSVVAIHRRTTGKVTAAAASLRADRDLRNAPGRLHSTSQLGCRRKRPRHLCRADREDPLLAGPRDHGRRAAACFPVRSPGLPTGAGELLGILPRVVLRPAPGLQFAARPAWRGRRVPRHGEGLTPGRNRSHSRRRVQPHGRGQSRRTDLLFSGAGELRVLHPGT